MPHTNGANMTQAPEAWELINSLEHKYLKAAHAQINQALLERFNFVGFAYRGMIFRGGREQTMRISKEGRKRFRITPSTEQAFLRMLVYFYLDHFGSSTTINNLVLEHYYRNIDEAPRYVHLEFGSEVSKISDVGGGRLISLSERFLNSLGSGSSKWGGVHQRIREVAKQVRPPIDFLPQDLRRELSHYLVDEQIIPACWYLLREEPDFIDDILRHVLPNPVERTFPHNALRDVSAWLTAFQGLLLFRVLGKHWITVPVQPYFKAAMQELGIFVPLSAVTAICDSFEEKDKLLALARKIETCEPDDKAFRFAAVTASTDSESALRDHVSSIEGNTELAKLARLVPILPRLLSVARQLIRYKHEGKPLSFTVLCAPETALLRLHKESESWRLKRVDELSDQDFIGERPEGTINSADLEERLLFSIKSNSFTLQEPGHALYLVPYSLIPREIIAFHPFDASQLDRLLAESTADGSCLAIQVRTNDARLFASGKVIARSTGQQWEALTASLRGDSLELEREIRDLPWCQNCSESALSRLPRICSAVYGVARRGYGALFFISRSLGLSPDKVPERTPMGPVWGLGRSNRIEDVDPEYLATFAGLDGETFVNIDTGEYATRQYLLIPEKRFLRFFQYDDHGSLRKTDNFEEFWNSRPSSVVDQQSNIERFGTRHQKALQITFTYPDSVIAVTVSSDGPIRIWHKGYPIRLFKV